MTETLKLIADMRDEAYAELSALNKRREEIKTKIEVLTEAIKRATDQSPQVRTQGLTTQAERMAQAAGTYSLIQKIKMLIKGSVQDWHSRDITDALRIKWPDLKDKEDLPTQVSASLNRLKKRNPPWLKVKEKDGKVFYSYQKVEND